MKNLLKTLVVASIFLSVMALPVLSFAFLHENQVKQSAYLSGEIIIKFKDDATIGAVASELVQRRQAFREITGNTNLDNLNARYKVKSMHRVFGKKGMTGITTGSIDISTARKLHRQQHEQFQSDVMAFREKRWKKKKLQGARLPAAKEVPYLGAVYRVEVDSKADIEETCSNYARDPNVAYCQPNFRMEALWIPDDPYYSSSGSWGQSYDDMWGLKKLETAEAWDVTKGAGVVVAVVDTGIDNTHPDIAANVWVNSGEIAGNGIDDDNNGFIDDVQGWNFYSSNNIPADGHGHGTHCSGTIAAIGNNGTGVIGVAPSAKIMPVKGLSDAGSGFSSGLAAGIIYAADNGADVISNSWGCSSPCPSNPVNEDAVKYAHDQGAVVVFAAGNNGQDLGDVTQYSPQNQSNSVITVAASTELDTRSYFSTIGSLIAVAAPGGGADGSSSNYSGRNILSLRAAGTDMYGGGICIVGDNYYRSRGTSMAAPHVSGVAALVLANHPEDTPDDVKQVLRISADDIESPGFDLLSGAGRVNAQKAVNTTSVPRVRITSPIDSVDAASSTVTITGDAYGTNFAKYQLFYATIDKTDDNPYDPVLGSWQALGAESFQSVTDGVLGSFASSIFQTGLIYLIKLEVTTTDNLQFSDIKEITPRIADTTPDQFTFTAQTGMPLNTVIYSNSITVSGINVATPISITGGEYSISGSTYKSTSGIVVSGNTVKVRLTSSGSYSTTTDATLTIGGTSGAFSVTTQAENADTTPDQFTFTDQTGVDLSTVIYSDTITISGIDAATPISITGGTYSINGGAYTSASGTVVNGNTVRVRLTSSGSYSTTTNATLTIGGVSDIFSVTTFDVDTTPDQFTFTAQTGVPLSTVITSNAITVSGINTATSISITGGEYSINGNDYTSDSGTVLNGDTVTVQLTSSGNYSTTTNATLTMGGTSGAFSVTTQAENADTTPDQFTFTAQTGVPLSTLTYSNIITIYGIDAATPISVTGGEYSINGGAYTSASGIVFNGNTVKVRQASAASYSTKTDATLTIGGVFDTFSVTTFSSSATSVTMTFEGLTDWEIVGDYYNGGYGYDYYTGLPKSGPGPNYGVIFQRIYAAIDSDDGGSGNFGGEPSPSTAIWFQQGGAWMNVTNGFIGSLSFYYSNPNNSSKIYIYDGLNRTGNLLATLNLPLTPYNNAPDPTGSLSPLVYVTISFAGVAKSVDFSAEASSAYIDDITLGTLNSPVDTIPDQFTFTDQTGVALSTLVTSNTITVSGINAEAPISITGGKYSINGGGYTSASGKVNSGNTVTMQLTSSESYLTTTNAILTIGGVSDTFSVTTIINPARLVTITVDPNPDSLNAPWKLTGPGSFSLSSNGDAVVGYLDSGEYTITWGDVAGWDKPASSTNSLAPGDSIILTGNYHLTPVVPSPPTQGFKGSTITINGSNFGATQGNGYVDFNGVHGSIVSWSDIQIVVTIPAGATSGCLTIVTDYGTSSCMDFVIKVFVKNDVNGDGLSDIFIRNSSTGKTIVYFLNATGTITGYKTIFNLADYEVVGTGDVNGDGLSDIFIRNSSTGQTIVYFLNATGAIVGYKTIFTLADYEVVGTGDVNGDGLSDIFIRNSSTGKTIVYFLNATGVRTGGRTVFTLADYEVVGTGDVNGDGLSDIFIRNSSTGQTIVYFLNATGAITGYKTIFTLADYEVVGTGDVNGDGLSDIFIRNSSTGKTIVYFLNATGVRTGGRTVFTLADYEVVGSGDVNGDGLSDIFIRNSSTGQTIVYFLNATGAITGYKTIFTLAEYEVVP